MFPKQINALCLHQINGFDHLTLGANMKSATDLGPARIYVERSYFFDDTVYVGANADKSVLPWLHEVGLAPREIVEISHPCIFQGLKSAEGAYANLAARVKAGARPHFFRTTALEEELVRRLEIDWSDTLSCDPRVAEKMADKAYIRNVAAELGEEDLFPPHICLRGGWSIEQVESAVWRVVNRANRIDMKRVVVKRTDLASGDGFCDWFKNGHDEFCKAHTGHELIVEAWIDPHIPISNQWLVLGGEAIYIGTSRQLQKGFVHKGNIIASDDEVLEKSLVSRLKGMTQPLLKHAISLGYNGIIGFDAVYSQDLGKMWLTEANARVTAGTYAYALAARLEFSPWAIACKIIEPRPGIVNFAQTADALGYLLYKAGRENGIAPYMLSGLALPHGQRRLGLMSIANNPKTAEYFLEESEKRLAV